MKKIGLPLEVRIENTNYCNAQCTICPREQLTRAKGYMDMALYKKIIDDCVKLGIKTVHLHGFGEPLLEKNFSEKVKYAKEKGIKDTFIVTNGALLNQETAEKLIEAGLDRIKISFFGINETEYEGVHRNLKYQEVRENIKGLYRLKKILKRKNPKLAIKYIGKYRKFLKFIFQWFSYGQVTIAGLHNYGAGRDYKQFDKNKPNRVCKIIDERAMQIFWDGRVIPCCYDFNGAVVLGDLTQNSIKEIWYGEKYTNFRRTHKEFRYKEIPFCFNCDKLK